MMSFEEFRKATDSGTPVSMQTIDKGDTIIRIFSLEARSEKKKRDEEQTAFERKLVGTALPDIPLKRLDGSGLSLSALKGRIFVINLWFVKCAPCVAEIPELNEVVNYYRSKPDVLFFAAAHDEVDALKKFLSKHRFSYVVLANSKEFCEKIGVPAYPTHIVVDSNGLIAEVIVGGRQGVGKILNEAIDRVLAKAQSR